MKRIKDDNTNFKFLISNFLRGSSYTWKNRERLQYFLIILLIFSNCSTRRLLFKPTDLEGWILSDWSVHKSKEEFEEILSSKTDLFTGYDLTRIVQQELSTPIFNTIKIEMYFTKNKSGAKGLYRRYQSFLRIPLGEQGSESPGFISFYRNRCFVKIYAVSNFPNQNKWLKKVGEKLDNKLISMK